jgi:hypothetical protein
MSATLVTAPRPLTSRLGSPEPGFWTRWWTSAAIVHQADVAHPARTSALRRTRFAVPRAAGDLNSDGHVGGGEAPGRRREGGRRVVGVGTPSGEWLIGLDPATRLCVAVHRPTEPDRALFEAPAFTVTAASSWELEAQLGIVLGDDVHEALRAQTVSLPLGVTVDGVQVAARGSDQPSPSETRLPRPSDLVHVPGVASLTYAVSLERSSVLLRWEQNGLEDPSDVFRVDVVAVGEEVRDGRRDLTYRLSLNGRVLLAGDDIEVPADVVAHSSETLRGLIAILTSPDDGAPPSVGQEIVLRRRDELLSLVAENPGPLRPDERVEVRLPDGRLLTGTITTAIQGADGTVRSYQWTPDPAWLPGVPLGADGAARGGFVSPAQAVRASLLPELAASDLRPAVVADSVARPSSPQSPSPSPQPPSPNGPDVGLGGLGAGG